MSDHQNEERSYWFPAKVNGIGWGMPTAWQGWVTLIVYFCLMSMSIFIFPPGKELMLFLMSTAVLTLVLLVICWTKGESPL
jgi:hypothetical protein